MNDQTSLHSLREHLPALWAPIAGADPGGNGLRGTRDFALLREARREDDASLPTGVWQHDLKTADWLAAQQLASRLLSEQAKDLLVASWLGEAWIQRYQAGGLCVALELLDGLCERYGLQLHPRTDGAGESWLVSPLNSLIHRYAELMNLNLPLLGSQVRGFESFTLDQWRTLQQQARNKSDERRAQATAQAADTLLRQLREALGKTPAQSLHERVALLRQCSEPLARLDQWCDKHLQEQAPSFAPLRKQFDLHFQALQELLAMHPNPTPVPVAVEPANPTPVEAAPSAPASAPAAALGQPSSRDDAYRQLQVISDYLARVEPHSPVPYLINRAIDWGNKPLRELLGELIAADTDTRKIWTVLGVLP